MTNGKQWLFHWLLAALLCLCQSNALAETGAQFAANPRIAVVNVADLLEKSPQAIEADSVLKSKYAALEQQLDTEKNAIKQAQDELKQQVEAGSLTADAQLQQERDLRSRERTYRRSLEDYRDAVSNDRAQALDKLQTEIFTAIDKVREKEGIDIVFRENTYITASTRIDMTAQVLAYLVVRKNQTAVPQPANQK
ncbi:MAG: hypothetical protein RI964_2421 [Pseudomonadota bacterium]